MRQNLNEATSENGVSEVPGETAMQSLDLKREGERVRKKRDKKTVREKKNMQPSTTASKTMQT